MKSLSVTIQRKAAEQYFTVVLFIMLHKVFVTFLLSLWIKSSVVPVQMKTTDEKSVTRQVSQCVVCRTRYVYFWSISSGKNMKAKKNYFFVVISVAILIRAGFINSKG